MRRKTTSAPSTTSTTISAKRRLALVAGSDVSPKCVLEMIDSNIDYNFLLTHKIPVANIQVGGLTPSMLRARGATGAADLAALGYDALHLLNLEFLTSAVSAYGSEDLLTAFLKTPYDAVALAEPSVMQTLSLTTDRLLEECAGSPAEAVAVLHQIGSLASLSITTLLDTGIRGPQLAEMGYSHVEVALATGASAIAMEKLQMSR